MPHEYSILAGCEEHACCAVFELPRSLPKPIRAARGLPMVAQCPSDLELRMAPEAPGIQVADTIANALGYLLVSGRLRKLLEAASGSLIEFLGFTLINHKGRIASQDCAIANVLGTVDCVDRKRSIGVDNPLRPDEYMRVQRLVLRPDAIPPEKRIFRVATAPPIVVIRNDLRAEMQAAGMRVTYYELDSEVDL